MFKVIVPDREEYDDDSGFITIVGGSFTIEHSLLSISKWESKWKTPFFGLEEKTIEQTIDYVKCMTIEDDVDPEIYYKLTEQNYQDINDYIHDPMTATTFTTYEEQQSKIGGKKSRLITSELIYYYMAAAQIPFECETWNLNRLMTLLKIAEIESHEPKKMNKAATKNHYNSVNKARRAKYHKR